MNLIKWVAKLIVFGLVVLGIKNLLQTGIGGGGIMHWFSGKYETESLHTVVLQEITTMGKLELVKYNFKDVVEQELVKTWLPNSKAVLIVQGEATGCIDLTKVVVGDIVLEQDELVVHLPDPELCNFKIDHSKSKVYNTEYAFTDEARLVDEAYRQAEKQIEKSALDMGIMDQTRENARKVLTPLLEKISGKKIILKFPMRTTLEKLR